MTFLRRLFGKLLNPEKYERVQCDACDGRGVVLSTLLTQVDGGHVETHRCWKCHGKGWLMVKRSDA